MCVCILLRFNPLSYQHVIRAGFVGLEIYVRIYHVKQARFLPKGFSQGWGGQNVVVVKSLGVSNPSNKDSIIQQA